MTGGPTARGGARGFTLVELLVVLTLFGLISTVLVGGLRFGARAWDAGAEKSVWLIQVETVQNLMRHQFDEMVPPRQAPRRETGSLKEPELPPTFLGESDSLTVASFFPTHVGLGGINNFEFRIVDDEDLLRLDLIWSPYPSDDRPIDEDLIEERRLIQGFAKADFSYYGILDDEREARWHDSWDAEGQVPELVALNIEFPEDDGRYWPALLVAPRSGLVGSRGRRPEGDDEEDG